MKRTNPLAQFLQSNHGYFFRDVAHDIGLSASVLLLELIDTQDYFLDKLVSSQKHGDGWFYATEEKIERRTGIRRKQQESDIKTLKELHLIETCVFGLPATRHFRLNVQKIAEYLGSQKEVIECTKIQNSNGNLKKEPKNHSKKDSRMDKCTNCDVQLSKPVLIYTSNIPKEDPEEIHAPPKGDASCTNCTNYFKSTNQDGKVLLHPYDNVSLSQEEHERLVTQYGLVLVQEAYFDLSEWKESANPVIVAKHKSDYRRLRKWVIPNLAETRIKESELKFKESRLQDNKIAPHRRGSKLVTPGDYENGGYRAPRI